MRSLSKPSAPATTSSSPWQRRRPLRPLRVHHIGSPTLRACASGHAATSSHTRACGTRACPPSHTHVLLSLSLIQ
eukprot:6192544-Pleurochrysis_carterae.AAC.2